MQLRDMNEFMIDKDIEIQEKDNRIMLVTKEKEELAKENKVHKRHLHIRSAGVQTESLLRFQAAEMFLFYQELRDDIEELRRAYRSLDTNSADSAYLHPDIVSPADDTSATRDQQETQEETEHLYDTIGEQNIITVSLVPQRVTEATEQSRCFAFLNF